MSLLEIEGLKVCYGRGRKSKEVVHGVDLYIEAGETLGLVGESGSGKTTIGRAVLGLAAASAGRTSVDGLNVKQAMSASERKVHARAVQVIFQDPYTSLSPSLTVADTLCEPLIAQGTSRRDANAVITELLDRVQLPKDAASRLPREFSGGQRQRVAIARALALQPKLIVCDEPVSALDLTTQAVILELLINIQRETGIGYLFISHDLSVVRHISHRVAVMYRGDIVEQGDTATVTRHPSEDYTKRLLLASPIADPRSQRIRRQSWISGRAPKPQITA